MRIGLSATQSPIEEIARFLVGGRDTPTGHPDCTIVDAAGVRIVEPGAFELLVGPSSRDEALLAAGFDVVAG